VGATLTGHGVEGGVGAPIFGPYKIEVLRSELGPHKPTDSANFGGWGGGGSAAGRTASVNINFSNVHSMLGLAIIVWIYTMAWLASPDMQWLPS